jgi:predicted nucleic acid-binding protein
VPGLRVEPDLPLVPEIAGWDLGAGESQVLAQVLSRPGWEAVLDDAEARRCARALALPVTGTLGILLRAKKAGVIPAARPLVESLVEVGSYLPPRLTEDALRQVGE